MQPSGAAQQRDILRMARFVLENGLDRATLRPLAAAAGTSDRMLIYRFGSKDRLIAAILAHLAEDLAGLLEQALPPAEGVGAAQRIDAIIGLLRTPAVRPYLRLWLEILARALRGEAAFEGIAAGIMDRFLAWVEREVPPLRPDPRHSARAVLTLLEGVIVMEAAGRRAAADAAIAAFIPDA